MRGQWSNDQGRQQMSLPPLACPPPPFAATFGGLGRLCVTPPARPRSHVVRPFTTILVASEDPQV